MVDIETDIPVNILNGRINISGNNENGLGIKITKNKTYVIILQKLYLILQPTPLADLFFSQQNMDILQLGMRI